jgi:hypothetical protein
MSETRSPASVQCLKIIRMYFQDLVFGQKEHFVITLQNYRKIIENKIRKILILLD